jgi:hypothetical protein
MSVDGAFTLDFQLAIQHAQFIGHAVVVAPGNILFAVQTHKSSQAFTTLDEYAIAHVKLVSECDNPVHLSVHVVPFGDH